MCRTEGKSSTEVQFTPDMTLHIGKDLFLANHKNKQRFIDLLSCKLRNNGCVTFCSEGDADCMIVAEVQESAKGKETVVVDDDTDLLVLLVCHFNSDSEEVFLKKSRKPFRCWNIKQFQSSLSSLCHILPVIHAAIGCDTTSRAFGTGKRTGFQKFLSSERLCELAETFLKNLDKDEIVAAAEQMLLSV